MEKRRMETGIWSVSKKATNHRLQFTSWSVVYEKY